jgi:hypothetical protein
MVILGHACCGYTAQAQSPPFSPKNWKSYICWRWGTRETQSPLAWGVRNFNKRVSPRCSPQTGIGSSRELARILDSQKIWDKNIGLSGAHCSPEDTAPVDPVVQ